jgi:hypothetical protein
MGRLLLALLAALLLAAPSAVAAEGDPSGAGAPGPTGGVAYREPGAAPVVELLRLSPAVVTEGQLPRVAVRVGGPLRALVRVTLLARGTRRVAARLPTRRASAGELLRVRLPARTA